MQATKRWIGLAALALVAAACGGGGTDDATGDRTTPPATQSPATGGQTVRMTDQNQYDPATLTIATGTTVTWENTGQIPHTVTAQNSQVEPNLDSGMINGGAEFSHTFNTAGTFSYFCEVHPDMKGTVTIQ